MKLTRRQFFATLPAAAVVLPTALKSATAESPPVALRKIRDVVIYRNPMFYCAMPSVIRRPDGEIAVAFRRAPERRAYGEKSTSHQDANAQLVLVRSRDEGATWSAQPELIYAHPAGGCQDPCMVQLRDGSIVCTSYAWFRVNRDNLAVPPPELATRGQYTLLGGLVLRSDDGARSWKGPFQPCPMLPSGAVDAQGKPIPMFNRGAMCEGRDGRLYWAARSFVGKADARHYDLHLLISADRGETWSYACPIATNPTITFTETSLIETPAGDLVAFVRGRRNLDRQASDQPLKNAESDTLQGVALEDHRTYVIRSTDGGKSFGPWQDAGFFGFPCHALRLRDGRVWLVYSYRKKPYGVRGRLLNAECTDFADAREIVLRDDGGTSDLGYPWSTLLSDGRVLTVYYFNAKNGLRHIAGTVLAAL